MSREVIFYVFFFEYLILVTCLYWSVIRETSYQNEMFEVACESEKHLSHIYNDSVRLSCLFGLERREGSYANSISTNNLPDESPCSDMKLCSNCRKINTKVLQQKKCVTTKLVRKKNKIFCFELFWTSEVRWDISYFETPGQILKGILEQIPQKVLKKSLWKFLRKLLVKYLEKLQCLHKFFYSPNLLS